MKFYQEITIIPNHEIDKNFILSRLFFLTHLGLVEVAKQSDNPNKSKIAIAFPEYQYSPKTLATKIDDEQNPNSQIIEPQNPNSLELNSPNPNSQIINSPNPNSQKPDSQSHNPQNLKNSTQKNFVTKLGTKLRLFTKNREDLESFNASSRFSSIIDYIKITEILEVPVSKISSYAVFMRHQEKTNLAKISKRYLQREQKLLDIINNSKDQLEINKAQQQLTARQNRRENLDINEFVNSKNYNNKQLSKIDLPFINVVSNDKNLQQDSNNIKKNYFKLWVKKTVVSSEVLGEFNTYGFAQNLHGKGSGNDLVDIKKLPTVPEF